MEKKKYYIVACVIILLLAAGWILFGGTGPDNNNVADTIQRVSDDNKRAGKAVDDAKQEVTGAAANAARTLERIERSTDIVESNSSTIAECRDLVAECQESNRRAKQILEGIELRNKETAAAGKDKSN